ncbi:hypothetical protein C4D60_Mb05t00100 [Musa balbisiana]|uniref:Uncharacterized protein n=1 Tax=Musa balbisiana TaxID=52838 RepID=A0A4S8JSK9_MUSBA|nr:hypothetical protein C4D60_Mb05t00100 [Musa balbisiana]
MVLGSGISLQALIARALRLSEECTVAWWLGIIKGMHHIADVVVMNREFGGGREGVRRGGGLGVGSLLRCLGLVLPEHVAVALSHAAILEESMGARDLWSKMLL